MDKRDLADLFRERLRGLIARDDAGLGRFAREIGADRSALSQFLDPRLVRLPRAETLRRIAETQGVTVDWLLGLSHAQAGQQAVATSVEIETAVDAEGGSPLSRWRREASGGKLRYVPATLPDMLRLPEVMDYELEGPRATARQEHGEGLLDDARLGDIDIEIAMPLQTLAQLGRGGGIWGGLPEGTRRAQLALMAALTEAHYPRLRLHLYDGRKTFSAPFTVFGAARAAIYLGRSYLVLSGADQVRAMSRHFDGLVREAVIGPDRVHVALSHLAEDAPPIV
jgi:hypothetical protein